MPWRRRAWVAKAPGLATFLWAGTAAVSLRDQIKWRGLPCPLKSEGSPEQLGGPLGASLKPEGSPESKWVSGRLWSAGGWPRGSDCAPVVRQLGQSHRGRRKLSTMLEAQKLFLFLGRCIGVGPPPLLLLLANAGYDGDSHYVHLGVERGNEPQAWARADGGTATPRGDLDGSDAPSVCRAAKHSRRVHPTREAGLPSCGLALLRSRAFNRLVRVPSALLLDRCHQSRLLERHVVSLLAE